MRITLVISSLGCGGAERVMTTLANEWARKGWRVTIVTIADTSADHCYELDPAVSVVPLSLRIASAGRIAAIRNNLKRLRSLRRAITASRPDTVLAFMTANNILTLIATLGMEQPVVVSERISEAGRDLSRPWLILRALTYRRAAWVVVQTREGARDLARSVHGRIKVIANPVAPGPPSRPRTGERKQLIAMGRLASEKGFDLLLTAFARLADAHPGWDLTIWGEGPRRRDLERLRDELGLRHRVRLPGITKQPREELARADAFVLSSRMEGFPNALCEAMATGLPVAAFACPHGPADIITDDHDGVLVPLGDIGALTAALDRVMSDSALRERLGSQARRLTDRFSLERITGQWESLLMPLQADD